MESEDWPDTQPVEDAESQASQAVASNRVNYWGRLYPISKGLKHYDLVEPEVHFSKNVLCSSANCTFSEDISFKIKMRTMKHKGRLRSIVTISDNSKKGILVNDRKMQRISKFTMLLSNDKISLPNRTGDHHDAYVFVNSNNPISLSLFPHQVTTPYEITYRLGVGAFGEVFLAFDKATFIPMAMKSVLKCALPDNDIKKQSKLVHEVTILRAIDHPHVVSLVDVVECKSGHFIFLEFMEGKDLSERIREKQKLQENIAKLYFYQLSKAVEYLHNQGIVHRDIKPANVLLASVNIETIVKLTDFGLSKILTSSTVMKTVCGTKMYAAPELLSGESHYTSQVDIWSLGVLLYTCLSGTEPFSVQPHLIEKHIMRSLYVMLPDTWREISTFAKNLVDTMLLPDPNKRIGIHGILQDVWLQDAKMYARLNSVYRQYGVILDND